MLHCTVLSKNYFQSEVNFRGIVDIPVLYHYKRLLRLHPIVGVGALYGIHEVSSLLLMALILQPPWRSMVVESVLACGLLDDE